MSDIVVCIVVYPSPSEKLIALLYFILCLWQYLVCTLLLCSRCIFILLYLLLCSSHREEFQDTVYKIISIQSTM